MKPDRRFVTLESLSFVHSTIYILLLLAAFGVAALEPAKPVLGWAHGIMWIVMSLLCLWALRARVIPLWLAVCVIVIGGLGPFVGTAAFVIEGRRRFAQRNIPANTPTRPD
jgi:hypothetical protein